MKKQIDNLLGNNELPNSSDYREPGLNDKEDDEDSTLEKQKVNLRDSC